LADPVPAPKPSGAGLDFYVGELLDERYKLARVLGHGGMGWVFLARHVVVGKPVAVKILDSARVTEDEGIQRLFREAQAAAAIGHPSIIDVHDVGFTAHGDPYLVMEYLEGADLSSLLKRLGALSLATACAILDPILSALASAHAKGILHRDLKPSNIYLVRRDGAPPTVKLIDFGISKFTGATGHDKLTVSGAILGTPAYMSPEQARGKEDLDGRTDLYAIGVMLYLMLTGELPFAGANYNELLFKIINEPTELSSEELAALPERAGAIIQRAMHKDAAERYQSADELLAAIQALEAWQQRAAALDDLVGEIEVRSRQGWDLDISSVYLARRSSPGRGEPPASGELAQSEMETRIEGTQDGPPEGAPADLPPTEVELSDPDPTDAFARPRRRPRSHLVLLALAPIVGAAAAVAFWLSSPSTTPEKTPAASASTLATAGPKDGVQITVSGAPSGAQVLYDGAPVSMNPFRVKRGQTIVPIRVELEGYQPFVTTVVPSKDTTVEVSLQALPSAAMASAMAADSASAPPAGAPPGKATPTASPGGIGKSGRGTLYTDEFE